MALGQMSFSATNVSTGLDAEKPINPSVGDQYVATDTQTTYTCYTAGSWAGGIRSGLDANKPGSPVVGDTYAATDTEKFYVCYASGEWAAESPIERLYSKSLDGSTGSLFVKSDRISVTADTTSYNGLELKETWTINTDIPIDNPVITMDINRYETRETTKVQVKLNDVELAVKTMTDGLLTFNEFTEPLQKGDVITIYADAIKSTGVSTYYGYIDTRTLKGTKTETFNAITVT